MDYHQMRSMERSHVCAQCGSKLVTIWSQLDDDYRLVCGADHSHQGYKQILSTSKSLARGTLGDELGPNSQQELEKMAEQGSPTLTKLPTKDIATNEVIPVNRLRMVVEWGRQLDLKPELGHVCLYYGDPYVTIDGYYYKNNTSERPYIIGTRPATELERQLSQIGDRDQMWIAEAWLDNNKLATIGLGIVTQDEMNAESTKRPGVFRAPIAHSHPQRMAEKRAEWQLLRKLIPLEVSR